MGNLCVFKDRTQLRISNPSLFSSSANGSRADSKFDNIRTSLKEDLGNFLSDHISGNQNLIWESISVVSDSVDERGLVPICNIETNELDIRHLRQYIVYFLEVFIAYSSCNCDVIKDRLADFVAPFDHLLGSIVFV